MAITLKSLQLEMRDSFANMLVRIDTIENKVNGRIDTVENRINGRVDAIENRINGRIDAIENRVNGRIDSLDAKVNSLDININERLDNLSCILDAHIKETACSFRQIDQRFDSLLQDITITLSPYFFNIEKMLANHEKRLTNLETKH